VIFLPRLTVNYSLTTVQRNRCHNKRWWNTCSTCPLKLLWYQFAGPKQPELVSSCLYLQLIVICSRISIRNTSPACIMVSNWTVKDTEKFQPGTANFISGIDCMHDSCVRSRVMYLQWSNYPDKSNKSAEWRLKRPESRFLQVRTFSSKVSGTSKEPDIFQCHF